MNHLTLYVLLATLVFVSTKSAPQPETLSSVGDIFTVGNGTLDTNYVKRIVNMFIYELPLGLVADIIVIISAIIVIIKFICSCCCCGVKK